MNKKIFYSCEDGNDICIKVFDTLLDEAKDCAMTDEDVKEIFKYVIDEDDIECLGCVWKKED